MSTLQVANLHFESTGNNRIQYMGTNTITMFTGGLAAFTANDTTTLVRLGGANAYITNSTGNFISSNTLIGPGSVSTGYRLYVNGTIYATGDITALSDISVKDNIMTITNALDTVSNLRGVSYTVKETGEGKIGLIAQEVKKVLPEVVVENSDNIGIAYQNIVAVLIEAVKELKKKVEDLESK
jgi:hypothetical protein